MTGARVELWRFPVSHYCDMVEFELRLKGIPYTVVRRSPAQYKEAAPHIHDIDWPFILADGKGVRWQDAASWMDRVRPSPSLYPDDKTLADQARRVESYFQYVVGHTTRRLFFGRAMEDPSAAFKRYRADTVAKRFRVRNVFFPIVRSRMGATAWTLGQDDEHLDVLFRGDGILPSPTPGTPLFGPTRGAADVAAATLLSPLFGVAAFRERWGGSPLWTWAEAESAALRALPIPA